MYPRLQTSALKRSVHGCRLCNHCYYRFLYLSKITNMHRVFTVNYASCVYCHYYGMHAPIAILWFKMHLTHRTEGSLKTPDHVWIGEEFSHSTSVEFGCVEQVDNFLYDFVFSRLSKVQAADIVEIVVVFRPFRKTTASLRFRAHFVEKALLK